MWAVKASAVVTYISGTHSPQIPGTEGICVLQELSTEMMLSKSTIVTCGKDKG